MNQNKPHIFYILLSIFLISSNFSHIVAQDDVMMQAFYWNVPVDETNKNGFWWDSLSAKAADMSSAGITGIWVPSPAKGNWGIVDMGYGIFDHYDLGNYNQKGTTETRFGSKAELTSMISTMHNYGIDVYADVILNHIYGDESEREINPAVKSYVFNEAYTNGSQHTPYTTNEITWRIENASAGDYYIQIVGYQLDWNADYTQRGYDVFIDWTDAGPNGSDTWENEPNNGSGQNNVFPGSGRTVRGHAQSSSDIDEYKITLTSTHDIIIKLIARKENSNPWEWAWANQTDGYYPKAIWHNGSNLASSSLQALTVTGIDYITHTGTGEPNYSWTYSDFHPVDSNDWLGDGGSNDEVVTNTKWFGNDLNTFSSTVQTRLQDWGEWLADEINFDGFRLDFVRGFQESFAAGWINNLPLLGGSQRFIVAEYWGNSGVINDWVNTVASYSADADAFDFPLKFTLTDMCNKNQNDFNMAWLNNAGMVRNNSGDALPGTSIVTFLDNHDSGKENDKWVWQDWEMAYAYMLTHEGRPCIFYNHYYGITQVDNHDASITVTPPSSLQTDINYLINVRKTYLGGSLTVLSQVGNPYPSGDTYNVYVARRQGNGSKDGAIVVINNHDSNTKGLWVDSSPSGYSNWANTVLYNASDTTDSTQVYSDGRVWVSAPPRSYKVYVKKGDFVSLSKSQNVGQIKANSSIPYEFELEQNYPNPFNPSTTIGYSIPKEGYVELTIYNSLGEKVERIVNGYQSAGKHKYIWNPSNLTSGIYIYRLIYNNRVETRSMMFVK